MTIAEISEKKKDILAASAQTKSPFFEESRPSSPRNHSVFTWFRSWLQSCMKLVQLCENFRQNPDTDRTLQTIVLYVHYWTYFLKSWNLSERWTCVTSYRCYVNKLTFSGRTDGSFLKNASKWDSWLSQALVGSRDANRRYVSMLLSNTSTRSLRVLDPRISWKRHFFDFKQENKT